MSQFDQNPAQSGGIEDHLEAEIEAALGDMSVEDMLDDVGKPHAVRGSKETKTGTIICIRGDDVFVEFGPKSQGVCSLAFFKEKPQVGEQMEFVVDRYDEKEGLLILSRRGTVQKAEWESLEVGQRVEARCTGTNKGGLELEIANHRAFMPAGQVDIRHVEQLEPYVNEKLQCEVIELDRQRGRIILSRRAMLEAERAEQRDKLLNELEEQQTRPAVITSLQPYGAFADLGGIDGLIHISDMSYERIKHPSEVVKEGDQVEVKVLKIERERDPIRISLGLKQLKEDPHQAEIEQLSPGDVVTGRVTKLMGFGAFVEIAKGVEGLIHISELAHERISRPGQVVKPNQVVNVKVLSVDPQSRKVSLSLKQMQSAKNEQGEGESRDEDPEMRKLKAQLSEKFGDNLKGGLG